MAESPSLHPDSHVLIDRAVVPSRAPSIRHYVWDDKPLMRRVRDISKWRGHWVLVTNEPASYLARRTDIK